MRSSLLALAGSSASGVQTSTVEKLPISISGVRTPTTSWGRPFSISTRPTTPGSAPKRRVQAPWLSIVTGAAPLRSSESLKLRPSEAPRPQVRKNDAVAPPVVRSVGSPLPVSVMLERE